MGRIFAPLVILWISLAIMLLVGMDLMVPPSRILFAGMHSEEPPAMVPYEDYLDLVAQAKNELDLARSGCGIAFVLVTTATVWMTIVFRKRQL